MLRLFRFGHYLLMPGQNILSWFDGRRQGVSELFRHYCKHWTASLSYSSASCCRYILLTLDYNSCERSVFGEDALVNVSVEKKDDNDGKLAGYIRIRSKTQGIALSLGDRITSVQRGLPDNKQ